MDRRFTSSVKVNHVFFKGLLLCHGEMQCALGYLQAFGEMGVHAYSCTLFTMVQHHGSILAAPETYSSAAGGAM